MFTAPRRPVSRARVALGALALLGVLAGVIAGTHMLRHPEAGLDVEIGEASDPRDEVVCPDLDPRGSLRATLDVTTTDLFDCPATYDGRRVRYQGEVVGALLQRSGGVWTQLNDDPYAFDLGPLPSHRRYPGANAGIGVHLPAGVAEQVRRVGGPGQRGDVLVVTGTFHRVDPASREIAVIRVDRGAVQRRGQALAQPLLRDRQVAGVVLTLAAVALVLAHRAAVRRRGLPGPPAPAPRA